MIIYNIIKLLTIYNMKITNIVWDTDGQELVIQLPKTVEIPDEIEEEEIADYISDLYGFCIFSLEIEEN